MKGPPVGRVISPHDPQLWLPQIHDVCEVKPTSVAYVNPVANVSTTWQLPAPWPSTYTAFSVYGPSPSKDEVQGPVTLTLVKSAGAQERSIVAASDPSQEPQHEADEPHAPRALPTPTRAESPAAIPRVVSALRTCQV